MSIKERSWKSIPINISGARDLICFEELTEYNVTEDIQTPVPVVSKPLSKKQKRKQKRLNDIAAKKRRLTDGNERNTNNTCYNGVNNLTETNNKNSKKTTTTRKKNKRNKQKGKNTNHENALQTEDKVSGVVENDCDIDMTEWDKLLVPNEIKEALKEMSFSKPTKIQQEVIKIAIQERVDIVAAAETGSGKTLAFGIPLLYHMLEDKARGFDECVQDEGEEIVLQEDEECDPSDLVDDINIENSLQNDKFKKNLPALILAPTRELAIQVKDHLSKVGKYTGFKMTVIVGGMSSQKQERLLGNEPDIIIATPGRLWEFIEQGHQYLLNLHRIRYLIIDEADRMLERGHFEELVKILDAINKKNYKNEKRQTYMFSATLTTVHHVPNRLKTKGKVLTKNIKLETLMKKIGIKEKKHVVDITTKKGTAEKLYEAKIICSTDEKDLFMYYFIRSHPGRTLVFTNSIDCIFHITGVLQALSITPFHLHAKMQQRHRLKHLERFRANPDSILIASDVAARGLDIPDVQHVIHYQVPRTCETYIHRSGRCARTGNEGLSLLIVSPEELSFYKRLCNSMQLENGIPQFPYDQASLASSKKIVKLAKEIDALGHSKKKIRLNNDWFTKAAAEMDIELDDDMLMEDDDDESSVILKQKQKQLQSLLKKPIFPKQFSGKYLTKTGQLSLPVKKTTSAIEEVKKISKK
uniref:ATP-dependent RNA helicase ddx24-like n=1 Tax=Styela clava TaxID=7725 RepID=UPI00193AC4F4|nr:ATP-dependent RNA helicase ddx24-like [Styela clava]